MTRDAIVSGALSRGARSFPVSNRDAGKRLISGVFDKADSSLQRQFHPNELRCDGSKAPFWGGRSGRLVRAGFSQDGVQFGRIGIGAQLGADAGVAHGARDKGQRLEVIDATFLGREKAKDQIDRLAIN